MLPFALGRITIEAAGADAAVDPGRQAAVARCCVCGVESPETVDAKSLDHVRHAANNVAKYPRPKRGHGRAADPRPPLPPIDMDDA